MQFGGYRGSSLNRLAHFCHLPHIHYFRNEASLEALQQVGKKLRMDPSTTSSAAGASGGDSAAAAAGAAAARGPGSDSTYWARGTGYGFGATASRVS
jgi:hypothetical protein